MKKIDCNSILLRLFLSFLLVIMPVIIVGILIFSSEEQTIKSQIEDSAYENISFQKDNLQTEIENINLLQYNLANDSDLKKLIMKYANVPDYDYYSFIANVEQRLSVMQNSNNYIQDVLVYIPEIGHTISAASGYLDLSETEYERLLKLYRDSRYSLIFDGSDMISTSVYPLTGKQKDKAPFYLIEVVLAQDKVQSLLGEFGKYDEYETALYDNTTGKWVFSSQSDSRKQKDMKIDLSNSAMGKSGTIQSADGKKYFAVSSYCKYLNLSFVQYLPMEDTFRVIDRYIRFLWLYVLLSLLIMVVYVYSAYKFVKYPIDALLKSFRCVEGGNLGVRIRMKATNEFNDLFEGFNKMVFRLKELIDKVYVQELNAKKAELKQLQAQINPHFLYNSYFMLQRMIQDRDMEDAELLSSCLGKYFQYITRNASEDVPLQRELEYSGSYAQIQQMRFSARLSVEIGEIPGKYQDLMVPRMILQPVLENAFEHGLKSTVKNGMVRLNFKEMENGLMIAVEDNGGALQDGTLQALQRKLLSPDGGAETTGIINVHRRIALKYGPGSGLTVSRSTLGGLRVEIRIIPEIK